MILAEREIPALRYDGVAALLRAHDRGAGDHAELLWRVFALERWYRRWIRGEGRRPERPRPRAWTREEVAA
jgi:hypothetical protein